MLAGSSQTLRYVAIKYKKAILCLTRDVVRDIEVIIFQESRDVDLYNHADLLEAMVIYKHPEVLIKH